MLVWIKTLDRILKGEVTRPEALAAGAIELPAGGLSMLLVGLAAFYGLCMGTFALVSRWGGPAVGRGLLQMVYGSIKVPMLFALTMLITLPSLYVFNALVGCRLSFTTVVRMLIAALGVTLAVLASVGTIVVFFSLCTASYAFMVLLNVLVFGVAGILGMHFLMKTLQRIALARTAAARVSSSAPGVVNSPLPYGSEQPPAPPAPVQLSPEAPDGQVRMMFAIWVIVFGLVGAQMGWVLRPFIAAPTATITFFRPREGNFFRAVADRLGDLAGETVPRRPWAAPVRESGDSRGGNP